MTEDKSGRELTPRESGEVDTPDASLTPVEGESRDVERFSAGPRAHSAGLTEERSAQIVRSSANARNVIFLAVLLVALFIPVYWFYEAGIPALGTESRLSAEAEAQYVTDVARGYELYQANCAECHGENGQGGVGPRLNDQGKLYNVLTPAGDPGNGHLNPVYLENVLVVGGRYVCGDPDSLMAAWQEPDGPLNYRQVEELIAWMNASQDVVFTPHGESHGEGEEEEEHSEPVSGWRDPNWEPGPDDTPVPACWRAPNGLTAAAAPDSGTTTDTTTTTDTGTATTDTGTAPAVGGTPEDPRVVIIEANSALQFLDETGAQLTQLDVVPGETIQFQVDNTAGFDHNFYIGLADALQVPSGETDVGIPTWQSGVQELTWTVPEEPIEGLQFACTVPGHYQPMHGDIVFTEAGGGEAAETATEPAEGEVEDETTDAATGGTPEAPRVIQLQATASLDFTDTAGNVVPEIAVVPGETIVFEVDNVSDFDHNFWIGPESEVSVPNNETFVGHPNWQSGVQVVEWTVPSAEELAAGLQFACTVPGHYAAGMFGNFVVAEDGGATAPAEADTTEPAETTDEPTEEAAAGGDGEGATGGTAEDPRVIRVVANAALQFLDESGQQLTAIDARPGEVIEFVVDNTAGFEHNFYIGSAEDLQVPYGETDVGIPTWTSGVESLVWTVPESGADGLQFACTVPGHYTPMHGDIVISS